MYVKLSNFDAVVAYHGLFRRILPHWAGSEQQNQTRLRQTTLKGVTAVAEIATALEIALMLLTYLLKFPLSGRWLRQSPAPGRLV